MKPEHPLPSQGSASALWAVNPDGSLRLVYGNRPDQEMKAASHIKLMLVERLSQKVKEGTIDPSMSVTIQHGMIGNDPGRSRPAQEGMKVPLLEAVDNAMRYSSNTDTNLIIHAMYGNLFAEGKKKFPGDAVKAEQYAFDAITKDLHQHGYPKTTLNNFLNLREDQQSARHDSVVNTNVTTPNDVGVAMQRLWDANSTPVDQKATSALKGAKEKLDPNSLGEKVSGTSLVKAHAGRYQRGNTQYISVGFLNGNGGDDLSTFKPFLQEAESLMDQDQKLLAQGKTPPSVAPKAPAAPASPAAAPSSPASPAPAAQPASSTATAPEESGNPLSGIMGALQPILTMLMSLFAPILAMFTGNRDNVAETPQPDAPATPQAPASPALVASVPDSLTPSPTPRVPPPSTTTKVGRG
jgi:hypothetical protein